MRAELIQAAELLRSSEPAAMEQALGLLQHTVYSFSMKICGHPEDAEDTMQEVLYRSLPHLQRLEEPQALAVWLYTVTRNRCWRMRGKGGKAARQILSLDALMPTEEELSRLLIDPARSPEDVAVGREESRLLQRAILELPAELRIVLVLSDMEELNSEQVGRILELKPGTVRVRLHRARLALRKGINHLMEQDRGVAPTASRPSRQPNSECRAVFANLSEYLDRQMEPVSCEKLRAHIHACPACVAFLGELRRGIDRCRKVDATCDAALTDRLRKMLTEEYLRLLSTAGRTQDAR